MSTFTQIRQGLAAVLVQAEGINSVEEYPPPTLTGNGMAWVGFFDDAVTMSNREIHEILVPITVVVLRNAKIPEALAATEPVIQQLLELIRANQTLGLETVYRVEYVRVQQGIWRVGDGLPYVGFQITLKIKDSFPVVIA